MKKIFLILVLVLLLPLSANAHSKIHAECKKFGFDLGIVRWQFNGTAWNPRDESLGTSVTGNSTEAEWDVGTLDDFGATGIVVKAKGKKQYSVVGDSDIIVEDKKIAWITFCLTFEPCGTEE